jgi:hypothetical protein
MPEKITTDREAITFEDFIKTGFILLSLSGRHSLCAGQFRR